MILFYYRCSDFIITTYCKADLFYYLFARRVIFRATVILDQLRSLSLIMAINIGFSACVLRSVLQSDQKLIAWFAPLRGPRFGPNRTVFGSQQIDSSFPDKDIR